MASVIRQNGTAQGMGTGENVLIRSRGAAVVLRRDYVIPKNTQLFDDRQR